MNRPDTQAANRAHGMRRASIMLAAMVVLLALAISTTRAQPHAASLRPLAAAMVEGAVLPLRAAGYNAMTPRRPSLRPRRALPPRLRGVPQPPRGRTAGRGAATAQVRVTPSEALRLAQRRWPRSIGLSVRLLKDAAPVYLVRLRAQGRVFQVRVDAMTGRILQ